MLTEPALSHALERAGLSAPVRFDEVTRSTQVTALELAREGAPEWTLVAAGHQTEGRGRLGRTWRDEPGRALMFSVLLRPELSAERGGLLSLLAGVALVEACRSLSDRSTECKWPNDLLVDGRKAGGVLLESRLDRDRIDHAVLGVGVNLGTPPPDVPNAGAVDAVDEDLLAGFLAAFARRYEPRSGAFATSVVGDYRERCATLGLRVRARTVGGGVVEGVATDVDEAGGLVVRADGGTETVRFGEVEHLE
jgi:BirA family biotin operon repressor/biotin-[acetyl-CoA-carboxylase] ligase